MSGSGIRGKGRGERRRKRKGGQLVLTTDRYCIDIKYQYTLTMIKDSHFFTRCYVYGSSLSSSEAQIR